MTLAVAGIGLVSPIAMDATQHALFVEAGLGRNPPTAFPCRARPARLRPHAAVTRRANAVAERMAALAEPQGDRGAGAVAGGGPPRGACLALWPRRGEADAARV